MEIRTIEEMIKELNIDNNWVIEKLSEKVGKIDWEIAKKDVQPFLRERQLRTLDLWNKDFFLEFIVYLRQQELTG